MNWDLQKKINLLKFKRLFERFTQKPHKTICITKGSFSSSGDGWSQTVFWLAVNISFIQIKQFSTKTHTDTGAWSRGRRCRLAARRCHSRVPSHPRRGGDCNDAAVTGRGVQHHRQGPHMHLDTGPTITTTRSGAATTAWGSKPLSAGLAL